MYDPEKEFVLSLFYTGRKAKAGGAYCTPSYARSE
jgi:hypothetical protein